MSSLWCSCILHWFVVAGYKKAREERVSQASKIGGKKVYVGERIALVWLGQLPA